MISQNYHTKISIQFNLVLIFLNIKTITIEVFLAYDLKTSKTFSRHRFIKNKSEDNENR